MAGTGCRVQVWDVLDELRQENRRLFGQLLTAQKLLRLLDQFRDNVNQFYHTCQCMPCLGVKTVCHQLSQQYTHMCHQFVTNDGPQDNHQLSSLPYDMVVTNVDEDIDHKMPITVDPIDNKMSITVDPIRRFVDNVLDNYVNQQSSIDTTDQVVGDNSGGDAVSEDIDNYSDSESDNNQVVVPKKSGKAKNKPSKASKVVQISGDINDNSATDRTKCEQCLQVFQSSFQLSRHVRHHTELFDRLTQKFICTVTGCGVKFKKFSHLFTHKTRHFGEKQFKCAVNYPECEWSFYTAGELRNHQIGCHSPQQLFHCDWIGCDEGFKIKTDLDLHKTYKHNDSQINLETCDDTPDDTFNNFVPNKTFLKSDFKSHYSVIKHRKSGNVVRFVCNYNKCDFKSATIKRIVKHIQNRHLNKTPVKCEECDDTFWTQKELLNHIRPNHSSIYDQMTRMFKCNQCSLTFDKYCKLVVHRNRHSGEKGFKCSDEYPDCKWTFFTIGELKNHQLWSHNEEQNYVCDWSDCGKRFKLKNLLEGHKLVHTGEEPFKCCWPGCDSRFTREPALKVHMTSHTGDRPFVCDWPECGHSFRAKANLQVHYTSHINDRRFLCEWPGCDSRFLNAAQLRRHYLCHKSEGDFVCTWDNCTKKLKTQFSLNVHIMAHRGEKPVKCTAIDCDMRFTERGAMRKHFKRKHLKI